MIAFGTRKEGTSEGRRVIDEKGGKGAKGVQRHLKQLFNIGQKGFGGHLNVCLSMFLEKELLF